MPEFNFSDHSRNWSQDQAAREGFESLFAALESREVDATVLRPPIVRAPRALELGGIVLARDPDEVIAADKPLY